MRKEESTLGKHEEAIQQKLRETLSELGGKSFRDEEDILRGGTKIQLPEYMTYEDAIRFIDRVRKADQETMEITRTFRYRPMDGAYCTYQAFKRAFGSVGHHSRTVQTMFGPVEKPPALITLNVGVDEVEQIPWGNFDIPFLPGVKITLDMAMDPEVGPVFQVTVASPRKFRYEVEGLFALIENELKANSIYKGKAIDGQVQPDFIDLSGVDPDKVVYSGDVKVQLEANLWSVLRHTDEMRKNNLPRKRAVLMHGPYGTGKTLGATVTAQVATENGWTFLYARPGKDDLDLVMKTARLYQPAVVFFEDMDVLASPDQSEDGVSRILDMFDGLTSKGTEIAVVLTTNHPDRIHKGMLRPGRLDSVIEIASLDEAGIQRMVEVSVADHLREDNLEWSLITSAMEGFMPAYIKEACDRALRYAISRNNGTSDGVLLDTEDFVNAANGLRPQLELMEGAKDTPERDELSTQFNRIVKDAAVDVAKAHIRVIEGEYDEALDDALERVEKV